ncbi:MAG: efflux RND transporter periplasmic adaptor subunit [Acidobacteria bacterium]|jgi:membrane fusion protein, multidrug efflux system|nr:MAG: efflux RND transporter periplasmic adaptor subunit [Acidobacteriota bacterium]
MNPIRSNNRRILCHLIQRSAGPALLTLALMTLSACSHTTRADSEASNPAGSRVTVGVVTAQQKDLARKISLPGTLVALNEATLYGRVAGYLRSIRVDKGDRVRRGDVLAVLEVPEMVKEVDQAQAAYQQALADLNRSKAEADLQAATFERYLEVHTKDPDAISKQELDQYRSKNEVAAADVELAKARVSTARANVERLVTLQQYSEIIAPFSGVVTARFVDPGALIQAGTSSQKGQPVVTLQDLDTIRIYVSVPEVDVPFVRVGTPATLTTAAYPGTVFKASVTRFAEALDPATRTMKTEIDVRNRSRTLRPGMYANVTLDIQTVHNAIVIPDSALAMQGTRTFVWVVRHGTAHRVEVETGLDNGAEVQIRSGVSKGRQVIIEGKGGLTEGSAVEVSGVAGGSV